jgi:hypothetical protein
MSYHMEFKTGDIDDVGAVLKENGIAIDLIDATVTFILKNNTETKYTIQCVLGGYFNGEYIYPSNGGVTIPFTEVELSTEGQYQGEFIVSKNNRSVRIPSGNNYILIMVWPAL